MTSPEIKISCKVALGASMMVKNGGSEVKGSWAQLGKGMNTGFWNEMVPHSYYIIRCVPAASMINW